MDGWMGGWADGWMEHNGSKMDGNTPIKRSLSDIKVKMKMKG